MNRTRPCVRRTPWAFAGLLPFAFTAAPAAAQTDYFNLDAGRPVTIENALPVERYALELQLAPARVERAAGGFYRWSVEPAVAYGILPRTHVEVAMPIVALDRAAAGARIAPAGVEIGVFHNLNTETRTLPAFALAAEVLAPVGGLRAERAYGSVKAIATRSHPWARLHVNAEYTFGSAPEAVDPADAGHTGAHVSRWMAGLAVDRLLPLQSVLVIANVLAREPLEEEGRTEWVAEAGVRWQQTPRLVFDAGLGRQLTGDAEAWSLTFGATYAFSLRALMPRVAR